MAITFGGKPTIASKMAAVDARYGKTLGASKGTKPLPKDKAKPTLKKGAIGIKVTRKF